MKKKLFKNWMIRNFDRDQLQDMVNHGVAGGFAGLCYYSETTRLYQRYKDDIWDILCDEAEAMGYSVVEMLAELPMAKNIQTVSQFENFAVWFAAESIANNLLMKNK